MAGNLNIALKKQPIANIFSLGRLRNTKFCQWMVFHVLYENSNSYANYMWI